MKRIIFYDLDGTLVDTRRDIANAANHMLSEMGASPLSQREVERYVGKGLYHLIEGCLQSKDKKTVEKGAKLYREHYAAHMTDHSVLYPGAKQTLDFFREKRQAVVTNKPDPFSRDLLEHLKVADYFVSIIAGNSEFPKKPNPAAIERLLDEGQFSPEDGLLIGDSLIDLETGRNAGITTVLLTHGFSSQDELKSGNPEFLLTCFHEFIDLAKEKGW